MFGPGHKVTYDEDEERSEKLILVDFRLFQTAFGTEDSQGAETMECSQPFILGSLVANFSIKIVRTNVFSSATSSGCSFMVDGKDAVNISE